MLCLRELSLDPWSRGAGEMQRYGVRCLVVCPHGVLLSLLPSIVSKSSELMSAHRGCRRCGVDVGLQAGIMSSAGSPVKGRRLVEAITTILGSNSVISQICYMTRKAETMTIGHKRVP